MFNKSLGSKPESTLLTLLLQLFNLLSRERRNQFYLMIVLAIFSSFAEVISLGAVIPFIGILTQPEKVFNYLQSRDWLENLPIYTPGDLILPLTVGFALAAIFAGSLRLLLSWVTLHLANGIGSDLSVEVYRRTLYQEYKVHVLRSSSEIISGITQKVGAASGLLLSLVHVITSSMLFFSILITLLIIDPVVASIAMLTFGSFYGLIAWKTRKRLIENGHHISREQTEVVKSLQEGLGAIRDILLDGTQKLYSSIYRKAVLQLEKSSVENNFINLAPRYVMEALGMVLVAIFAYTLSLREGGIGSALPILGSLALGAQRLLPLLQILYGNWTGLLGGKASLIVVLELMTQPIPEHIDNNISHPVQFDNSIELSNLSFRYSEKGPWVFKNIHFKIKKGASVGFIGNTGSGKSTILDLIMSLLEPTEGQMLIDGKAISGPNRSSWQKKIAHVPQNIYLADGTIAENIAFGIPVDEIDMQRVEFAAKQSQLSEFIESRKEGYNLFVGERGIRLSGGQRQRIGIARALYKEAAVLVFDEATSALDSETEKAVMKSLESLNKDLTVLIIAHRITTLQNCETIVQIDQGKIVSRGTYEDLLKSGVEVYNE